MSYYTFGNYEVNKKRDDYITLLSRFYPEDKARFKTYKYARLRAIYISFMNKRLVLPNG